MASGKAGWACIAGVLWLLAADALAQGPHRQFPGPGPGRGPGGGGPQRMMQADQRPDQGPGPRREQFAPGEGPGAGGGRMSPEERRQLRRDVHQAGRDLYSERMPPGRRGELGRQ